MIITITIKVIEDKNDIIGLEKSDRFGYPDNLIRDLRTTYRLSKKISEQNKNINNFLENKKFSQIRINKKQVVIIVIYLFLLLLYLL